jgi:integrase
VKPTPGRRLRGHEADACDGSRKPWHPDGANQRFNRIREKVPGAEKITPHQFRRSMATSLFPDGYTPSFSSVASMRSD